MSSQSKEIVEPSDALSGFQSLPSQEPIVAAAPATPAALDTEAPAEVVFVKNFNPNEPVRIGEGKDEVIHFTNNKFATSDADLVEKILKVSKRYDIVVQ